MLLGCAEAAAAGLGTAQVSAGARARLLHLAQHGPGVATMPDDGLFSGWAGVAVALRAWSRVAGDAAAAAAAGQVTAQIAGRIVQAPAGRPQCTDVISGDAGILLALIADDSDAAVQAAHVLADRLAEAAEPGPDGLHWRMTAGREYLTPGFSHGTAGVAYALAAAGRTLNRRDLVDVATHGARALVVLGHHPGGWAVPLGIPPRPGAPAVAYHLVQHRTHQDSAGAASRARVHAGYRRNRRLAGQTPRPSHPPRHPAHPGQARPIMALTAHRHAFRPYGWNRPVL